MFNSTQSKKNKIVLSDYNYRRDVENRLLMAQLSPFEIEILKEILYSSLTIPLKELAQTFNLSLEKLQPVLEKLGKGNLFKQSGELLHVNKEMRKYFESQIVRFEEDFRPDLEFLQGLLGCIPIHVLPNWYAISKTTDDIFGSIIEKYLQTPKTYLNYLEELEFDAPLLQKILDEAASAPDYTLPAEPLMEKLGLDRETFEELMLQLEFNLALCLTYRMEEGAWRPYLSPFYEWHCYLRRLKETECRPIGETEQIKRRHIHDFGFVEDLAKTLKDEPISIDKDSPFAEGHKAEIEQLLESGEIGEEWLSNGIQEQAMTLYLHSINRYRKQERYHDRDVRSVEKSLRRVLGSGWVYFDDFIKGIARAFGKAEPVTLKKRGRRWRYAIPEYDENDKEFVKEVIFSHLFQAGMVATGIHNERLCFIVTPFGRMSLGE